MARGLQNFPNINAPDTDYPNGRIKDNPGDGSGTPVDEYTNGDLQQFFAKMMRSASIVPNGLPDNEYSGNQYYQALIAIIAAHVPVLPDSGWQTIFQQNDWTNTSAQYRKIGNIVYLRGVFTATGGETGLSFGLLDAGFRPLTKEYHLIFADGILTPGAVHNSFPISIDTDGNIKSESFQYVLGDNPLSLYLDGISFIVT